MTHSFPTRRSSDLFIQGAGTVELQQSRHDAAGGGGGFRPDAGTSPVGQRQSPLVPEYGHRSEEHTSELQSLMRISYAVFCLKKKKKNINNKKHGIIHKRVRVTQN